MLIDFDHRKPLTVSGISPIMTTRTPCATFDADGGLRRAAWTMIASKCSLNIREGFIKLDIYTAIRCRTESVGATYLHFHQAELQ